MGIRDAIFGRRDAQPVYQTVYSGVPANGLYFGVSATTALGLSSVWRAVDILSTSVSQLPWEERSRNLPLPPSRLVRNPMPTDFGTRREWTSLVVATLALYDVCYLLKVGGYDSEGVPNTLLPLEPDLVSVEWAGGTPISPFLPGNVYRIGGVQVPRDRLVILRRSPLPGVSDATGGVIRLARTTFAAALAAEGYASRYWQAGGAPNTVLETDQQIPDPVAQQIAERYRERRAMGPDMPPVLTGGLKLRDMGADPTAQSAVEARREMVADIGRYFGVPTRLLNAPNGDSETYSSAESANQDLVRYTAANYIGAIEDAISDQLPGGRRLCIESEVLTRGTQLAQAQAWQLATGGKAWALPADAREHFGMEPLEDYAELNPMPAAPAPMGATE